MHSHKGSLSIDLMIKPPLLSMYNQIRKLHLKLHLKKIASKVYVETVTKSS